MKKENTCVLAYMLYKLTVMPLISNTPEPPSVYLQAATAQQRGRT